MLLSSHSPQQVLSFADHVVALKDGAVLAAGIPKKVVNPELLKELYCVDTEVGTVGNARVIINADKQEKNML